MEEECQQDLEKLESAPHAIRKLKIALYINYVRRLLKFRFTYLCIEGAKLERFQISKQRF